MTNEHAAPADVADLIARLREADDDPVVIHSDPRCFNVCAEAADALERLRDERYRLAYAICGGEDAPGLLDATSVEALERLAKDEHQAHGQALDRVLKLRLEKTHLMVSLLELCEACSGTDIKRGDAALAASRDLLKRLEG